MTYKNKIYAGIGARSTPKDILELMEKCAYKLSAGGYMLSSGGAIGADSAFENGAHSNKTIYRARDSHEAAIKLASEFHPSWSSCSDYARKLHGRNNLILLGRDLVNPVDFILCWTPRGEIVGGTGQALRVAKHYNIRVTNLGTKKGLEKLKSFLK